jgi:Uma2 family endonuclease
MITYPIVLGREFDHIPDDTEETLVGSSLHQGAIDTAFDGLRICAKRRDLPWFVGNQLTLLIRQEGRAASRRIAPDICVYPSLPVTNPTLLSIALHGPPTLALEVASPGTAQDSDVNLYEPGGKPQLYSQIGIEEYLVFDPTEEILGQAVWAQHRGPEGVIPWLPEDDGRWHSTLGVSFAPQGTLLRVYDHDGRLVPLTTEFDAMLAERDRRLAALEAELRRLRGETE